MNVLWVFLGGGIGAVLRYGISLSMANLTLSKLTLGTLISNVLASFLLGIFSVWILRASSAEISNQLNAFLIIGVCGGFSTFSTFSRENLAFIENGYWMAALVNILLSVSLTLYFVYLGRKIVM